MIYYLYVTKDTGKRGGLQAIVPLTIDGLFWGGCFDDKIGIPTGDHVAAVFAGEGEKHSDAVDDAIAQANAAGFFAKPEAKDEGGE